MPENLKNMSQVNLSMRRGNVVFGDVVYEPGGFCGPRVQADYQLVVIHSGWLDLKLDGKETEVAPGQAILLTPRHREHFLFSRHGQTHHSWCAVSPKAVPPKLRKLFALFRNPAPFPSHLGTILKTAKTASIGIAGGETLENTWSLGLALALLSGFAQVIQAGAEDSDPADQALARMDDFISREYSRPLQLADLARAAGVSRQHLMKLLRQRGLPTPTERLFEKRLETAADCLSHTGLSIAEISDRCGFANPFHFSRKFHQAYGKSPREWRVNAWKQKR